MKTALLVRLDKIGDLVLTLPVDQQPKLADYRCVWLVAKGMGFIPKYASPARTYVELSPQLNFKNWNQLWQILKSLRPDATVSFQAPWWINFAFFIFGVQKRIGVLSRWHSFLLFNSGLRQKRSRAENNELEYNHQLVHHGFNDPQTITYPHLQLEAPQALPPLPLPQNYIVIHPGMAGSARNWPSDRYIELLKSVISAKNHVIITGTQADAVYIKPLQQKLIDSPYILWWNEQLSIDQLLYVLSKADHVIAPSTGVLHLAAALGTAVTGIYSPVRVQRVKRWGPKGRSVQTITPIVDCPGTLHCLKEKCSLFDCMALVTAPEILHTISLAHKDTKKM